MSGQTGRITLENWLRFVKEHPQHVFLIGNAARPGVMSFTGMLEFTEFPPNTPDKESWHCFAFGWSQSSWALVAFPAAKLGAARLLASSLALRLIAGVPTLATGQRFPGQNARSYTIETHARDPIYARVVRDQAGVLAREWDVLRYLSGGHRLLPAQVLEYIYGTGHLAPVS